MIYSTYGFYRGNGYTAYILKYQFFSLLDLGLVYFGVKIVDWLVRLPYFNFVAFGDFSYSKCRAVAYLFLGVLAVKVKRSILPLKNMMGFNYTLDCLARLLLLLFQKIFEHSYR